MTAAAAGSNADIRERISHMPRLEILRYRAKGSKQPSIYDILTEGERANKCVKFADKHCFSFAERSGEEKMLNFS